MDPFSVAEKLLRKLLDTNEPVNSEEFAEELNLDYVSDVVEAADLIENINSAALIMTPLGEGKYEFELNPGQRDWIQKFLDEGGMRDAFTG